MQVVLDTNVLISSALSIRGASARLVRLWREREAFTLLVSPAILAEYRRVLAYPDVQKRHGLTEDQIDELLGRLSETAVLVEPADEERVVMADPADDTFLACALAGHADAIVSGDGHLRDVKMYRGIPILTPAAFLLLLGTEAADPTP